MLPDDHALARPVVHHVRVTLSIRTERQRVEVEAFPRRAFTPVDDHVPAARSLRRVGHVPPRPIEAEPGDPIARRSFDEIHDYVPTLAALAVAVVVDHGAKPRIRDQRREPWAVDLAAIAALPGVTCKLSGLVTEAAPGWQAADIHPYAQHILDIFGPQRVMFGSDWPVVNLAGGYDRWREAALVCSAHLAAPERAAVLGETARRVYLARRGRR